MKIINIICPVLLCYSFTAQAIVSMENIHLGKPPQGFLGEYNLDLSFDGGNTERSGATTGVKFQWTEEQVTDFILASYAYAESAGLRNKNKGFTHYRHIHQLDEKLAWEGFAQLSFNEFTDLILRALSGGGVRLALGEVNDISAFYLGLGAFYEHEELDNVLPGGDDTEAAVRGNVYLVTKHQFNQYVSLVSSTYYQPKLSDFADYRAIEDFSVVSKLTEASSLKVSVDIAYDSEPPINVKKTDSSLNVGIVVHF